MMKNDNVYEVLGRRGIATVKKIKYGQCSV